MAIFGHPKWEKSDFQNGHQRPFWKESLKKKIWNGEKCIRKWFSFIKNGRRQPFCEDKKKIKCCVLIWNGEKFEGESDFRSSNMAAGSHFVKKKKLSIDLKWQEMLSKLFFGHPKWWPAILWKKVAYWSEMARNAIESDFRSSKMVAGSHFVKKIKVAYWSEMARNAIENDFRSSKMAAGSHFVKIKKKIKVAYWSEMARNLIENDFRSSNKKNKSCVLIWNGEKCYQNWFSVIQNGRWQPFCEKKKVAYWSEMARNAIESDF